MPSSKTYLNLGCGSRCLPDWINFDIAPQRPGVIHYDIAAGIPMEDASCDVVYHAAVLEHLRRPDAKALLIECCRVLKLGGVVRVGVPDLEQICRLYLARLESALTGDEPAAHDYDWVLLELFDQMAREESGGGMLEYLRRSDLLNESFVLERIGDEGRQLLAAVRGQIKSSRTPFSAKVHRALNRLRSLPAKAGRLVARGLLGAEDRKALDVGRFRLSGEVHQWMYDRFSLARLLGEVGFREVCVRDAASSRIPDWGRYHLDTLPDGQAVKPDLFFMEAVKPGGVAS